MSSKILDTTKFAIGEAPPPDDFDGAWYRPHAALKIVKQGAKGWQEPEPLTMEELEKVAEEAIKSKPL